VSERGRDDPRNDDNDDGATGGPRSDDGGAAGDPTGSAEATAPADRLRERMREIVDPCSAATGSNLNVVEMGLLKSIRVDEGHADVEIRLTNPMCHMVSYFLKEIEDHVDEIEGLDSVTVENDGGFEWSEEMMSEEATRKRQAVLDEQEARYRRERGAVGSTTDA